MSRPVVVVEVYRAGKIGKQTVPDLRVVTKGEVPEYKGDDWEAQHRQTHEAKAKELADAFYQTLPLGTVDALLMELTKRRVSLFRVRF